jgi:DMSO/TMAO reductase YedYZ molybdopterin-dependent catalytic subunit
VKYLNDSLRIFGAGVVETEFSPWSLSAFAKERGIEYSGVYRLVTSGGEAKEIPYTGVKLAALVEMLAAGDGPDDGAAVRAFFKDSFTVSLSLGELRAMKKPAIIAYETRGLPLVGPTGREPLYKQFTAAEGYDAEADNSGGPLRLVFEAEGSNAPSCGRWLAALAVGDAGNYRFEREVEVYSAGTLPEPIGASELPEGELLLRIYGEEKRVKLRELPEIDRSADYYAARDGRCAFEGVCLRRLIERFLPEGAAFPAQIRAVSASGFGCFVEAEKVLNGVESNFQQGRRLPPLLAWGAAGTPLVGSKASPAYTGMNDGAPLRLVVENDIRKWIKGVTEISAE